ncbi:MAG: extracellular solute-binding protein [Hungatella hathewayi]|nr:extracellular solute-binding protein [Hungatella hathewayi]
MKKKTLTAAALTVTMILSFVSGCSSSTEKKTEPETQAVVLPTGQESQEQTAQETEAMDPTQLKEKIVFWGAWAEDAGPADWIAEFNKEFPGIEVEYVKFTNTDEGNVKMDTSLLAGIDVDVFMNFGTKRLHPRAEKGLVSNLDDLLTRDNFDVTKEYGENAHNIGGSYYGLPIGTLSDFVILNKSALDQAGLEVPKEWDLDTYKDYAQKLTSGEGGNKVYGTCDWNFILNWAMPAYSRLEANPWYNTEGLSNWDNEAYKIALNFKNEMENVLEIQYPYKQLTAQKISPYDVFFRDECNMAIATSGATRFLKDLETYPREFVTTFAPYPVIDTTSDTGGTRGTYFFSYISMGAKLEGTKREAAWQFMKWLGTKGNTMFASVGHIPAWKYADKDKIVEIMLGNDIEKYVDVDAFKRVVLNTDERAIGQDITNLTAYNQLTTIMKEEAELAIYGEKTVDQALSDMKQRSDDEIKKAQ